MGILRTTMMDVLWFGLVCSGLVMFWYSGMTPIIDWYLMLLLLLSLVVEHETGRATAGCLRQRDLKPQDVVSKHHRQPDRHRHHLKQNTLRRWRCELEAEPTGRVSKVADGMFFLL